MMGDLDVNPFADPFDDSSITQARQEANRQSLENYDPFGSSRTPANTKANNSQPVAEQVFEPPPPYFPTSTTESLSAPPVKAAVVAPIPGHEELLKRQEELERKAAELQTREQEIGAFGVNPRKNNWPPFPKCCPIGPCFYQDFAVDIPDQYRMIVKLHYYFFIVYVFTLFNNVIVCLVIFCFDADGGLMFGMSILWFVIKVPWALCWYRPIYNAFRKDNALYFFWYFLIMFIHIIVGVLRAVGIPGSGWAGWITALGHFGGDKGNIGVGIYTSIQASLFSLLAILGLILVKRVHTLYRSSGATFKQAQQEFAKGVMKNPGVQTAAATAVTSAVQTNLEKA